MMDLPWMDRRTASLSGNVKKNWAGSGTALGGDAPDVLMPPPPVVPQATTGATTGATSQQKESVQVKLELGHKAVFRKNPTPDGFTHDWTMFVRGPEGSNIQHFVDRVVFHLHESFPKPRRIVKDPPYQINESGYAGFNLPIEIYFKNKEDPKKILFHYDLFLHVDGCPPVNHVRCEKLTFQNPSEEFRRKLIKAGGVGNLGSSEHTTQPTPSAATPPSMTQVTTPESKTYADLFEAPLKSDSGQKKTKNHSTLKDRTASRGKPASSTYSSGTGSTTPPTLTPPSNTSQKSPPTTPTKEPRAALSTPTKSKEKSSKRLAENALSADLSKKKRKDLPSIVVEDVMKVREREERREREKEKQREKEKEREKEQEKEKERLEWEKEKKKERRSAGSKDSKSKHKSSRKDGSRSKSDSSEPKTLAESPPSRPVYAPPTRVSEGKVMPENPAPKQDMPILDDDRSIGEISDAFDDESIDMDVQIPDFSERMSSPASTLSFSSVKGTSAGGSGPLSALLAEMEDDEDLLSPLSTKSPAPHFSPPSLTQVIQESVRILGKSPEPPSKVSAKASTKESSPPPPQLKPSSGGKAKRKDKESRKSKSEKRTKEQRNQSKISKESSKENKETKIILENNQKDPGAKDIFREYSDSKAKDNTVELHAEANNKDTSRDLVERDLNNPTAPNGESLNVLLELQRRLMSMTDRDLLQQVVNVIEETGMYKISDATFDFDLCCLDITTVKKLQVCLEMTC